MTALLDKLAALTPSQLSRHPPATDEQLAKLEETFGFRFPDDFRAVMKWSGGFGMSHHRTNLNVVTVDSLEYDNYDEDYEAHLPGMFVLGTDNGGAIYFFDPHDRLQNGAFAVYLVSLGAIGFADAMLVGKSFTQALEASLAGEDLHRRPCLKKTPGWSPPGAST